MAIRLQRGVTKNAYVQGKSGWFSCRSICYLAAGKPVVVQETGFSSVIPAGEGIISFSDPDEAVDAIQHILDRHAHAGCDIVKYYFDSTKVLTKLVQQSFESTGTI